jgi:hypothetical protein
MIPYAHPKGLKDDSGNWVIRPVHYILFFSVRMSFAEWHHLYIGLIFMALGGWMLSAGHLIAGAIFLALGTWWAIDDLYQHWRQLYEYDPLYHSPVHILYGKYLYRFNVVKAINAFGDWLFGLFNK